MKPVRTSWVYSLDTETGRLLHAAYGVASGFYKINNFIVLPQSSGQTKLADNIVTLPQLPFTQIPRFWEHARRIDTKTLPIQVSPELFGQTKKLLAASPLRTPKMGILKRQWEQYGDQIIKTIYDLIPSKKNSIESITIWPTLFGTAGSFSVSTSFPTQIYIYLRADQSVASIVEAILSSLTRQDVYTNLNGLWRESEIIVDWLVAYSPLSTILKKIDPESVQKTLTIKHTREKEQATLLQESEKFLKQIGAPTSLNVFTVKNGAVSFSGKQIDNLTSRESEILKRLILQAPQLLTFDQIGDVLFGNNPDQFSLFAITKTIERLRTKLEQNGISGSFIQTLRGQGYLLKN